MAMKTPFSAEVLRTLLGAYAVGDYVGFRPFEQGADQTNLCVETTRGRFAFRYYEKRPLDYVRFEIDLLHHLAERGYPLPVPIANRKQAFIGQYHRRPFALFTLLPGDPADDPRYAAPVARTIARLHTVTDGFVPVHAGARHPLDAATCWQDAVANAARIAAPSEAESRLSWLRSQLDTLRLPATLPRGVVHADVNPSNFLYAGGDVSAVLDFDQATIAPLLYDLANLVYWWAWPDRGTLDLALAADIVRAYAAVRPLADDEQRHLFDALRLCILIGVGWFFHDADDVANGQRKLMWLDALGREAFYARLFAAS